MKKLSIQSALLIAEFAAAHANEVIANDDVLILDMKDVNEEIYVDGFGTMHWEEYFYEMLNGEEVKPSFYYDGTIVTISFK